MRCEFVNQIFQCLVLTELSLNDLCPHMSYCLSQTRAAYINIITLLQMVQNLRIQKTKDHYTAQSMGVAIAASTNLSDLVLQLVPLLLQCSTQLLQSLILCSNHMCLSLVVQSL